MKNLLFCVFLLSPGVSNAYNALIDFAAPAGNATGLIGGSYWNNVSVASPVNLVDSTNAAFGTLTVSFTILPGNSGAGFGGAAFNAGDTGATAPPFLKNAGNPIAAAIGDGIFANADSRAFTTFTFTGLSPNTPHEFVVYGGRSIDSNFSTTARIASADGVTTIASYGNQQSATFTLTSDLSGQIVFRFDEIEAIQNQTTNATLVAMSVTKLPPIDSGDRLHIALHDTPTTAAAMAAGSAPLAQGTRVRTDQETWNNIVSPAIGNGPHTINNAALLYSNGNPSNARFSSTAGFAGTAGNSPTSGNKDRVMMEGWFGYGPGESLAVTGLPATIAARFHVIIYGDSNVTLRTMNYTIGGQTRTIEDNGTFSGTFVDGSHFTVFTGLSGTSFSLTGNAATPRSAVNGLSIIAGDPAAPFAIESFTAGTLYIQPGASTTLSWQVEGADQVTIAPGIGTVTGNSLVVTPSATTTYTLTATRGSESRTATLRIGVGPPRPNIIYFFVDDMGWQDTSVPFYYNSSGQPVITPLNQRYRTPSMETLASRGIKFTQAYSMPVCSPSRVCWMTGLNSARHHVTNWTNITNVDTTQNTTPSHRSPANWRTDGLPQNLTTLPSLLRNAGYRTIHAGKAHFGNSTYARNPLNVGFDINIAGSEIGHPGSYSGTYGQGGTHAVPGLSAYHNTGTHLSDALTLEINKQIERSVADGTPFFAYMAHYAVHTPFEADPRFTANYPGLSGTQLAYATLIEGMDKSLGDILAKLEQLGIAENTFIIFMSDNGGDAPMSDVNQSNAPLRHKKGSKYEGGYRVPMLAAWAKRDAANPFQAALPVPASGRVDDLVAIFDLFPTFAAIADIPIPSGLDGHDLTPYLRGQPGSHRPQELLIHFPHDHRSTYFTNFHEGDWKLIQTYPPDTFELYHLATDISESNNLAAAQPERVMRMARKMARSLAGSGAQWPRFASNLAEDPLLMPLLAGVDSDGDGIPDNLEDPNRNGLVNPGETNPDLADTDGDGTPDGVEARTGTDPLNPSSIFQARFEPTSNHWILRWPSAPGASYRVEATDNPAAGSWDMLFDSVPASSGSETSVTLDRSPSNPSRFFRVYLK
jgi:arylsulfatase A-like enzyme